MNPDLYPFFDLKTGRPNIWHSPGENGELEFFSGSRVPPEDRKGSHGDHARLRANKRSLEIQKAARGGSARTTKTAEEEALARQNWPRTKRDNNRNSGGSNLSACATSSRRTPNDRNRWRTSRGVSYDELKTRITEAIKPCELAAQLEPHRAFIMERIGRTPHLTLHALKDELAARGVKVSHNAVWLFLRREGLRFKKNAVRP